MPESNQLDPLELIAKTSPPFHSASAASSIESLRERSPLNTLRYGFGEPAASLPHPDISQSVPLESPLQTVPSPVTGFNLRAECPAREIWYKRGNWASENHVPFCPPASM